MIVVDTNVLSEPLRPAPDPAVLTWLTAHESALAITSITIGELRYGVLRLPSGRRRDRLASAIEALIAGFGSRTLDYNREAANEYAVLRSSREASGRGIGAEDGMIAGICRAGGHELATRNVSDFADSGIVLHNPWR